MKIGGSTSRRLLTGDKTSNNSDRGRGDWKTKRLEQLVKNWGRFEMTSKHVAGKQVNLEYRYRNGGRVELTARTIDLGTFFADGVDHIKSKPKQVQYQKIGFPSILELHGESNYIGEVVAAWDQQLKPREKHFDKRVSLKVPLLKPGVYVVTATMENGNVSKIVVWITDTVIVKKQLANKSLFLLADAGSGSPVLNADLEFFGFRQKRTTKVVNGRRTSNTEVLTREFTKKMDANGQVLVDDKELNQYQWLIRTSAESQRKAFLGFSNLTTYNRFGMGGFGSSGGPADGSSQKAYVITDRPVYRPGHRVQFKIWLRSPDYGKDSGSVYASRSLEVSILNPKGEAIKKEKLVADEFGGIDSEVSLPTNAMLGQYRVVCGAQFTSGNLFLVEEYKKTGIRSRGRSSDLTGQAG